MSLNKGRPTTAMPGPSVLPERVMAAMGRQSVNIYEGELVDMADGLQQDLKKVAGTEGFVAIYQSNGHGSWEATLRNTINSGDEIIVISTGYLSRNWGEVAEILGAKATFLDYGMAGHSDPDELREVLAKDKAGRIKAVLMVQTETSSSVRNDVPAMRAAIDDAGHDAIFMVDCIASLGCDMFLMDEWGVDVMVAASQKGMMNPIGMAFVFFNDKADAAGADKKPGYYFDWNGRAKSNNASQRWAGSPPAHHMFALRESLDMMLHEEGMSAVWARHQTIAKAVWAAVEAWGRNGVMALNITDPEYRAMGVTTVNTKPGIARMIRAWCEDNAGLTLGNCLGFPEEEEGDHFRIGHMGYQNIHMVMGVLGSIETAMRAQGISHGEGALSAASEKLAEHQNA